MATNSTEKEKLEPLQEAIETLKSQIEEIGFLSSMSNPGGERLDWLDDNTDDLNEFIYIDDKDMKELDLNNEVIFSLKF